MKRVIIILITIAFIGCRDKKNANNVADTEVAIATLKAFYLSAYNDSVDNQEVLFKQYVSEQLLEKIEELSADMTLDYDPFIKGQDFFADVLNSTLKITPLENKNEYRCCFLLFGNTYEKETCVDFLLEKDKDGHFVISNILNDDILAGKRDIMPTSDDSYLGKILFRKKIDMNKDGIEDRFIVYDSGDDLFATIKIVLSDKGKEKIFFNNRIINNTITSGEGFRNISFENHFFTIEENTSTDPVQIKYTTFSIDYKTNEIFLYRVEVSNIFNNASDDFDIIRTQKDFGEISFEDYAS
ncbi:YbjP/YqhG family protein [Capnocytophaga catalasegens]|nr:YbjP/YqhG family protein [Capnocytophaga catalasegens]